jgi:hypothetical protein
LRDGKAFVEVVEDFGHLYHGVLFRAS